MVTNAWSTIWSWFWQSTRMSGIALLLRHGCLLKVFVRCLANIWRSASHFLFQIFTLDSTNGDIMLYASRFTHHASRMFFNAFLLVLFTLHTLSDLWKGSDSLSNKRMQRLQQKLSVLFLLKRLMIDSVQYSLQVWSIYQAAWRCKAKESGTHRTSVVHYNRRSLTHSLSHSSSSPPWH